MGIQWRNTLIVFLGLIAAASDIRSQNGAGQASVRRDKVAVPSTGADEAAELQFFCDTGVAEGCYKLGLWYRQGLNVAKNTNRAALLLQRACTANVAIACNELGTLYLNGSGVAKDVGRALQLFRQACDGKQGEGCFNLAVVHDTGKYAATNPGRAAQHYQQACDLNFFRACSRLGSFYDAGKGVARDATRAFGLYQKACDGNELSGCIFLGAMYANGGVITRDAGRAATLFEKACAGGEAFGCMYLADAYGTGSGVPLDASRARALYRRACDGGLADACSTIDAKAVAPASPTSGAPSVAGYQPGWIGHTMTVRGTVARFVQRKVNGEPYVYLYFRERPDSTVVACARDDRWLLGVLGVDDFNSVVGRTLEFNGEIVGQPCAEHGASLWIWQRSNARLVDSATR